MKWRRWVLLGLWLLSLITISNYGGVVSYGFFFGITLIPVISWIYLLLVYWRFKIYQELSGRNVVCGDAVPYFFVLQNDDYFAYSSVSVRVFSSFSYVEEIPDGIEYELLPKDKFTYETKLICKYRGEYEVGIKEIVLTDLFGLFQLCYSMPGIIKALVLPRIVRVRELGVIDDLAVFLQKESEPSAFRDTAEPTLRPEGISLRFIEDYEAVLYGEKTMGEEAIETAGLERKQLLKSLKGKKKWRYFYYLLRMGG